MSLVSGVTVILGDFMFPIPPNSLEVVQGQKVVEHITANVEGGATENLGGKLPKYILRGSLASGADFDMFTILRLTGTSQWFRASNMTGQFFISGQAIVNKITFNYETAHRFPHYRYMMEITQLAERQFELPNQGFGPKIYFWGGPGTLDPTVSGGLYRSGCFAFASGATIDITGTACVASPTFDAPSLTVA